METTKSNISQRRKAIARAVLLLILLLLFGGLVGFHIPYAKKQENALKASDCAESKDSLQQMKLQTRDLIDHMQTMDQYWGTLDSLFHLLEQAKTSTSKSQLLADYEKVSQKAKDEIDDVMESEVKGALLRYVSHEERLLLQLQKRCSMLLEDGGNSGGSELEELRKKVANIADDMDTYLGAIGSTNSEIQGFLGTRNRAIQEDIRTKIFELEQKVNLLKNL